MKKTFQFSRDTEDDSRYCPIFDDCCSVCRVTLEYCLANIYDRPEGCPLVEIETKENEQ